MNWLMDLYLPQAAPQLLYPCKLSKQVDAEMCMANVFFLLYSWKGTAWLERISIPAFETGRKFMVCHREAAVNLFYDD